jgi:transcriptional regulator with XRE-family HTH domain
MPDKKVVSPEEKARIGKKLGAVITRARVEKGFSRKVLAEKVGTSSEHLSRIETGRRFPSFSLLTKIAAALGTLASRLMLKAGILDTDEGKMLYSVIRVIENGPDHKKILSPLKERKRAIAMGAKIHRINSL